VVHLLAQPGDVVKANQPIVEFDPAVARANLDEKKTACDSMVASLRLLESVPRVEEQNSAKLAIEQAKLAVDKAKSVVDHLRPLQQKNEISPQAMYEAELALKQAELQWKTAVAQYDVLMLKPRPQAIAEAKSRIATAEAAAATAQAQLDLHTIRSPIDGVLDSLTCQLGQTLSVGTSIGAVVNAKQVHVVAWFSMSDARRLRKGQAAEIRFNDSKRGGDAAEAADSTLRGEVVFVGGVADAQTGNLPVRILVDNAQGKLMLGQIVTAAITVNRQKVLAVPASAVYDLGEGSLVNVVRAGETFVLHPTVGLKDGRWIEVKGTDLKPGDPVVVEGGYNLPEKTKVIAEAATEKDDGADKPASADPPTEKKP
jgi:RND family efflux transporter MFP subunit